MAVGDLITLPYQLEFNGILFGAGSNYDISSIDGIDLISVREGDEKRPLMNGAFDLTPDLLPQRVIILRCNALTSNVVALGQLRVATKNPESWEAQLQPLVITLVDGTKYRSNCRVRRRAFPVDRDFALGYGNVTLMFWAPDPLFYENSLQTAVALSALPATGGFGFDIAFDISFGGAGAASADATCVNSGDNSTAPVVTIAGPLISPSLTLQNTGEVWSSSINLSAGDSLVVDFEARTVILNGTATRYSTVAPTSTWWRLRPGSNVVHLAAASGTGSATIAWRSARQSLT